MIGLVEAEDVLRAGTDGSLSVTRLPGIDKHVAAIVKHRHELATRREVERRRIVDASLPVVTPATLGGREHGDLRLSGLAKGITLLAASSSPGEGGRRCLSKSREPCKGEKDGGRNHFE